MIVLVNTTAHKVAYYATGCRPESGEIAAKGQVELIPQGGVVMEVVFGGYSGDGQAPVRVMNVPDGAKVTLGIQVSNGL